MKKFFALLTLIALSMSMTVLAAENGNGNGYNGYNGNGYNGYYNGPVAEPVSIEGYIEYETDDTITVVSRDGEQRVILNITEETHLLDANTTMSVAVSDRTNDRVIAYYGPVMTRSEPPISNAVLILFNVNGNGNGYANGYNGNGYANGYNGNGYANGYNGNGYANGYNGNGYHGIVPPIYTPYTPPVKSLVDALAGVYSEFYTEGDITMVPLRQVAESMGFTVIWNEALRSITLQHSDGQAFGTVMLGQNSFEGRYLEATPAIRNDRTFVPVSFFEMLLGM